MRNNLILTISLLLTSAAFAGGYGGGNPQGINFRPTLTNKVSFEPKVISKSNAYSEANSYSTAKINLQKGAVQGGAGGNAVIQSGAAQGGNATIQRGAITSQGGSATANNTGNNQTISIAGTPANQNIVTVPGMGGLFVSGSSFDCVINGGGSGVFMGGGGQATMPMLSRPCWLMYIARQQLNAASVAYSLNQQDQVRPNVINASQLVNCGDETAFIASRATGYQCAVMPDRDALDLWAGGMPRPVVKPNPGYIPPKPPVVNQTYNVPKPVSINPMLDQGFIEEMRK